MKPLMRRFLLMPLGHFEAREPRGPGCTPRVKMVGAPLKRVHELAITEQDGDRSDKGIGWHYLGAP